MKNLKMFAIAVMAFAVMAMGVHAATTPAGLSCKETDYDGTCTLNAPGTITARTTISENTTIVTDGKALTIADLTIDKNVTLTIKGGNVVLNASSDIKVLDGAKLIVTGAKAGVNAMTVNAAGAKISVEPKAEFSVSDNADRGIVVSLGSPVDNALTITLDRATMNLNNNALNGSNGCMYIEAESSKIYANNNGLGGLNAKLKLTRETTVEAKGNGYAGVTIWANSEIEEGSTITATGNLKGGSEADETTLAERADVTFKGNATVGGKIVTDSIAAEKILWDDTNKGQVVNYTVSFEDSGVIDTKVSKTLCDTKGLAAGYTVTTCDAAKQHKIAFNGDGTAIIGDTATVYGAAEIELSSDVKNVEIESTESDVTIAPGTSVKNNSNGKIVVTTTAGDTKAIEKGKTETIGEPAPVEPTPGEGQTGSEVEGPGNQGPTDNVKNPDTNDNILVYAGLGLVSLASVAFTTRKRED